MLKSWWFYIILCLIAFVVVFGAVKIARAEEYTDNLWQGLVAEDTSGDYETYLCIASVVRNRLNKGMTIGLVALKRKNLDSFVAKECAYALKHGKDLKKLSQDAIREVFSGKNYVNGATHYEHTEVYITPNWAKNMQVVEILYQGTYKEITFWKAR